MTALKSITEFADRIAREFHPERIIRFGSPYGDQITLGIEGTKDLIKVLKTLK